MRILVCGDRNWKDYECVFEFVNLCVNKGDVIIEGEAYGADRMARYAADYYKILVEAFPANWNEYGRAAGPIRNKEMLDKGRPDVVVYFHDNLKESKGTINMIGQAGLAGIPCINGRELVAAYKSAAAAK